MSKLNARSIPVPVLRQGMSLLDRYTPRLACRVAESLFYTPPPRTMSERARRFLSTGELERAPFEGGHLATWRWGEGPTVMVLHGWGGRSSQFSGLVPVLVSAGCQVVAVDAPGHGMSDKRQSSLPAFAEALRVVASGLGPIRAVIGHSMGGAAAALAFRQGLPVEHAVFIASPADPGRFGKEFATRYGLGDRTIERLRERVSQRHGIDWRALSVSSFAPEMQVPLLVVHDKNDADVVYDNALTYATRWPGARLMTTEGLGHSRILHNTDVIREVVRFVAPHEPAT
ncbi:MAG TPA: alpha/beta hydrolase, partial [Candidatus Xenobia bacterium]